MKTEIKNALEQCNGLIKLAQIKSDHSLKLFRLCDTILSELEYQHQLRPKSQINCHISNVRERYCNAYAEYKLKNLNTSHKVYFVERSLLEVSEMMKNHKIDSPSKDAADLIQLTRSMLEKMKQDEQQAEQA